MIQPIVLAVFGLSTLAHSHMMMAKPVPFGKSTLNNSPLDNKGADFPCKQRTGVYAAEGASNVMPLGSTQDLTFTGSAVHGGGSCQISISYDEAPTASSVWKVIHSIEGGCPAKNTPGNLQEDPNGNGASQYTFKIPSTLPTGTAVLAWTWFNKIGNREMYMNCAPITITAGTSKRSEDEEDTSFANATLAERASSSFDGLPNMFVANIPTTSCLTQDSTDLKFPNPGDSVEAFGASTATPSPPTGPSCGAAIVATGTPQSKTAPAASATTMKTTTAAKASKSVAPASQGGVFVTVATSAVASIATSAPVVSQAPSSAVASKASPVASSAAPVGTGTGSVGSGSAIAAGTACSTEGMWNCIGGTSFQQCGSGTWSVVQSVAAGTKCTGGQSMSMGIAAIASKGKAKRSVRQSRFSGAHLRRHLHS